MKKREKRITIRTSEALHRKVKAKCALLGETVTDVLTQFLETWTTDVQLPVEDPVGKKTAGEST